MLTLDLKTILLTLTCFSAGMIVQSMIGSNNRVLSSMSETTEAKFNSEVTTIKKHANQSTHQNAFSVASPSIEHTESKYSSPTQSLVMEEIIPPSLHLNYTPENLEFNVTRNMLKRSRPIIGNTERLHAYIRKLQSKQCTIILFLGGSVTDGHHVKGRSAEAYPAHFTHWLNAKYPCLKQDGSPGKHEWKKTHAQNSQTHFIHWSMISEIDRIDLVFIEFNVNDSFISDIPHALEDKGEDGRTALYADLWYSEVLLRRLLSLRKPDPLAIITFNADYVGRSWAPPPHGNPVEDRKRLFRRNEEPAKLWINSLYEVPVISANVWMLPLASKFGMAWQFNKTHNPYSTAKWHADRCCHPHKEGHRILVMVLAYNIAKEEADMLSSNEELAEVEKDWTLHGVMRDPIYLSPEEESLYISSDATSSFEIDFTDSKGWDHWNQYLVVNDGPWKWHADNIDEDKFGLITSNTNGGTHVSIAVVGGKYGLVEIQYVVSYENFGIALAWVDSSQSNTIQSRCNTEIKDKVPVNTNLKAPQRLIAIWNEPASVPRVQLLHTDLLEGQQSFLHVCLTPKGKHVKGSENKFKLLGIRVY